MEFILGCGRLIVGEWSNDEFIRFNLSINTDSNSDPALLNEKKGKPNYFHKNKLLIFSNKINHGARLLIKFKIFFIMNCFFLFKKNTLRSFKTSSICFNKINHVFY